jgi:SAM-dependent methyltransferase
MQDKTNKKKGERGRYRQAPNQYAAYLRSEWEDYHAHPERFDASLAVANGREVSDVLDIGCGAGQELLPFVQRLGARGVGVDIVQDAMEIARKQFANAGYEGQVEFHCSQAESLPFADSTFDVVICRLALMFTHNEKALTEMGRVLRPGGIIILKIHHLRYYWRKFWLALGEGEIRKAGGHARAMLCGAVFHVTGRQPSRRQTPREVFQTRWMLNRILARLGLEIQGELENSDSNPRTPVFLIEKVASGKIDAGPLINCAT